MHNSTNKQNDDQGTEDSFRLELRAMITDYARRGETFLDIVEAMREEISKIERTGATLTDGYVLAEQENREG